MPPLGFLIQPPLLHSKPKGLGFVAEDLIKVLYHFTMLFVKEKVNFFAQDTPDESKPAALELSRLILTLCCE